MEHIPVMQKEVLDLLSLHEGENVVDGTLGAAGHASLMLKATSPSGKLIAFEVDDTAYEMATKNLAPYEGRFVIVRSNFRNMKKGIEENSDFAPDINAIFLDLGLSSMLIDQEHKGISFQTNGPLDMRFEATEDSFDPLIGGRRKNYGLDELRELRGDKLTAYDLVNFMGQNELAEMLFQHGVKNARRVSRYIVMNREKAKIATTQDLIQAAFRNARPGSRRHPATTTFQALRIVVNDELGALEGALKDGWDKLASGGRMAILSYHSLEDRIVKNFFKRVGQEKTGEVLTKKPLEPTDEEKHQNPRSRSAKLRVARKN